MNKFIKKALLSCLVAVFVCSLPASIHAADDSERNTTNTNSSIVSIYTNEEQEEINGFIEMQDQITSVLQTTSGRYSYDTSEIKSIVDAYDFTKLNLVLGSDYTSQSFIDEAIASIESTTPESKIQTRASICGLNKTTYGWNYEKLFASKQETRYNVSVYRDYRTILLAGGTIGGGATAAVPPLALLLLATSTIGAGWYEMLANTTERINDQSDCGTVTTVNKFVYTWTVKNQSGYNY